MENQSFINTHTDTGTDPHADPNSDPGITSDVHPSADPHEIAKFNAIAQDWWNPTGPMQPLHQLNPLRLQYIQNHTELKHQQVLDIGCGGGILAESLARAEAHVTAIDLAAELISVASRHAESTQLTINYQHISAENLLAQHPGSFDVITCMELLEHIPHPQEFLITCAQLLKPGGKIFFSTINRNLKSFFGAIIAAEYILQLLPKGTHQYARFIRPSELTQWANQAGLELKGTQGIHYYPLTKQFSLGRDVSINYLAYYQRY